MNLPVKHSNYMIYGSSTDDNKNRLADQFIMDKIQTYSDNPQEELAKMQVSKFITQINPTVSYDQAYDNYDAYVKQYIGLDVSPRTALQSIGDHLDQGIKQSQLNLLYFNALVNESDEVWADIAEKEKEARTLDWQEYGPLTEMFSSAANMLPQISRSFASTLAGGAIGGLVGSLAGPGGAAAGSKVGAKIGMWAGLSVMGAEEAGGAYAEILQFTNEDGDKIDSKIAKAMALGVGVVNTLIEKWQLDSFPGVKELFEKYGGRATRNALKTGLLKGVALRWGKGTVEESAQEAFQETVTILGGEIAKLVDDKDFDAASFDKSLKRVSDTFLQSAKGFAVLGLPGAVSGSVMSMAPATPKQFAEAKENFDLGAKTNVVQTGNIVTNKEETVKAPKEAEEKETKPKETPEKTPQGQVDRKPLKGIILPNGKFKLLDSERDRFDSFKDVKNVAVEQASIKDIEGDITTEERRELSFDTKEEFTAVSNAIASKDDGKINFAIDKDGRNVASITYESPSVITDAVSDIIAEHDVWGVYPLSGKTMENTPVVNIVLKVGNALSHIRLTSKGYVEALKQTGSRQLKFAVQEMGGVLDTIDAQDGVEEAVRELGGIGATIEKSQVLKGEETVKKYKQDIEEALQKVEDFNVPELNTIIQNYRGAINPHENIEGKPVQADENEIGQRPKQAWETPTSEVIDKYLGKVRDDFAAQVQKAIPKLSDAETQAVVAIVEQLATYKQMDLEDFLSETFGTEIFGTIPVEVVGDKLVKAAILKRGDKSKILLTEASDVSSLIHEFAHIMRANLTPEHFQAVKEAYGITSNKWVQTITKDHGKFVVGGETFDTQVEAMDKANEFEEKFVSDFEEYINSGKIANEKLNNIFAQLKEILLHLYRKLKGLQVVNPKVVKVFDEIMTSQGENVDSMFYQTEAWHGSPYKFSKFSLDKIGTGEGVLGFGYGLYATDIENLARDHAANVSTYRKIIIGDKPYDSSHIDISTILDWYADGRLSKRAALGHLEDIRDAITDDLKWGHNKELHDMYKRVLKQLPEFIKAVEDNKPIEVQRSDKYLYNVTLFKDKDPSEYTWLDWDNPVPQETLEAVEEELRETLPDLREDQYNLRFNNDHPNFHGLTGKDLGPEGFTGEILYRNLMSTLGGDKKASEFLSRAGVDGVRYHADFMGHGYGPGNSYVIFNDKDITINDTILFQTAEPVDSQEFKKWFGDWKQDSHKITLYRGLENKFNEKYDLTRTDAPNGYSTWTDNPALAREYAGEDGTVYKIELPKKSLGKELLDADGERALFVNNEKKAGLHGVSGDEYLVYVDHEDYSDDMVSEYVPGSSNIVSEHTPVSKVVDKNGEPLVMHHATTHSFNIFTKDRANPDNDMGKGFYFTNSEDDAKINYGIKGADLTLRIELLSEQIFDSMQEDPESFGFDGGYEPTDSDARDLARKELAGKEERVLDVYINMKDPVIIGKPFGIKETQETFLQNGVKTNWKDYIDDAKEELLKDYKESEIDDDMIQETAEEIARDNGDEEITGDVSDLVEEIDNLRGFFGIDIAEINTDLDEFLYDGGTASEIISALKSCDGIIYATDDDGTYAVNEIIREAFENLGYDGILDFTVHEKFGIDRKYGKKMEGVNKDTFHAIAFKPNQIKSVNNQGTWDPNNPNILFQTAEPGDSIFSPKSIDVYDGVEYIKHEEGYKYEDLKQIDEEVQEQLELFKPEEVDPLFMPLTKREAGKVSPKPSSTVQSDWKHLKRIDYTGRYVHNSREVAELFSVYRNTKLEFFHIIYTDSKDKILAHNIMSSGLPGVTIASEGKTHQRTFYKIKTRMERLGASGYYIMHNHPSGNIVPSNEDISVTAKYAHNIEGFKGHIILDHNEFALLMPSIDGEIIEGRELHYVPQYLKAKTLLSNESILKEDILKKYVSQYMTEKNKSLYFIMNNELKIIEVRPIKEPSFKSAYEAMRSIGGRSVIFTTGDKTHYKSMSEAGKTLQHGKYGVFTEMLYVGEKGNTESFINDTGEKPKWQAYAMASKRDKSSSDYVWEEPTYYISKRKKTQILAETAAKIKDAVEHNYPVPDHILKEYESLPWAKKEIARRTVLRGPMKWILDIAKKAKDKESLKMEAEGAYFTISDEDRAEIDKNKDIGTDEFYDYLWDLTHFEDPKAGEAQFLKEHGNETGVQGIMGTMKAFPKLFKGVGIPMRFWYTANKRNPTQKDLEIAVKMVQKNPRIYRWAMAQSEGDQDVLKQLYHEEYVNDLINRIVPLDVTALPKKEQASILAKTDDPILKKMIIEGIGSEDFITALESEHKKILASERRNATIDKKKLKEGMDLSDKVASYLRRSVSKLEAQIKDKNKEIKVNAKDVQKLTDRITKLKEKYKQSKQELVSTQLEELRKQRRKIVAVHAQRDAELRQQKRQLQEKYFEDKLRLEERYEKKITGIRERERLKMLARRLRAEKESLVAQIKRPPAKYIDYTYKRLIEGLQTLVDPHFRGRKNTTQWENSIALIKDEEITSLFDYEFDLAINKPMNLWDINDLTLLKGKIDQLRTIGRQVSIMKDIDRKSRLSETAYGFMKNTITGNEPTYGEGSVEQLKHDKASLREFVTLNSARPSRMLRILDGFREGPLYDFFWNELNHHYDKYLREWHKRVALGKDAMKELGIKEGELHKKISVRGQDTRSGEMVDYTYSVDDVIYLYVSQFNEYQRAAVIGGNNISESTLAELISKLDPKFIQWGDWLLKEFSDNYERLRKAHIEYANEDLGHQANYFTIVRDQFETTKMADMLAGRNSFQKMYTNRDMTKLRKEISLENQTPIRLGATQIWSRQVEKQEHYINNGRFVKDAEWLLDQGGVKDMVRKKYGKPYANWLQTYINDYADPRFFHDDSSYIVSRIRKNMAIGYLGFNYLTVLKQTASFAHFLRVMGPHRLISSIAKFTQNPKKWYNLIEEMSPQVHNRRVYQIIEDIERSKAKTQLGKSIDKFGAMSMKPIGMMDNIVVSILWLGAYDKFTETMTKDVAANKATEFILETQPASATKDLPQMYRKDNSNVLKFLLMFTNQLNQNWNALAFDTTYQLKNKQYQQLALTVASVAMSTVAISLISGWTPPEDEPYKAAMEELIIQGLSIVPLFGRDIGRGFAGWHFASGSPSDVASDLGSLAKSIKDKEAIEDVMDKYITLGENAAIYGIGAPVTGIKRMYNAIVEENPKELLGGGWTD